MEGYHSDPTRPQDTRYFPGPLKHRRIRKVRVYGARIEKIELAILIWQWWVIASVRYESKFQVLSTKLDQNCVYVATMEECVLVQYSFPPSQQSTAPAPKV